MKPHRKADYYPHSDWQLNQRNFANDINCPLEPTELKLTQNSLPVKLLKEQLNLWNNFICISRKLYAIQDEHYVDITANQYHQTSELVLIPYSD